MVPELSSVRTPSLPSTPLMAGGLHAPPLVSALLPVLSGVRAPPPASALLLELSDECADAFFQLFALFFCFSFNGSMGTQLANNIDEVRNMHRGKVVLVYVA